MHLVLLFCICCIPSAQSTFGPFMIGFFRARDVLKAADIMCSQFRSCRCQQGILSRHPAFIFGSAAQTLQREVSPFTRSRLWRKAWGETPRQRESDSSWLHLHFSVNFSWHEASEESRGTDGEMEGRGRRNYVWVQNVFSLYFGFVCLWHHLRATLEWWQCQPEKQQPAHTPTHNQKTNAKYDHRQYDRGTRQHPSDALKLQGWIILNGICNITFNFPSLWCLLVNFKLFYFCAIMIHRRDRAWFT